MPKLSLCMIIKPTKDEAKLLSRCLRYVAPYVDEICITQAGPKKSNAVSDVCEAYGAKESFFKWNNSFADARNFNFSQATGDYILWLDADDVLKGAEKLKGIVEEIDKNKIEAVVMNYLYDFNEAKECTVKHLKTRIVKRGCVKWVGAVHEDFENERAITSYFAPDIEVLHLTDKKRAGESAERNLDIAKAEVKRDPKDPRSYWLLGNALWGMGRIEEAVEAFKHFVDVSQSEEEKYLAYLILASLERKEEYALAALSLRPTYPNAYFKIAELKYDAEKYQTCIGFNEIGLQLPVPEFDLIVYNPRDYDYNPLMVMLKAYWQLGKTKKSVEIINKMAEMFPSDKLVQTYRKALKNELGEVLKAEEYLEKAKRIKDRKYLKKYLDKLPKKVRLHPSICAFYNENFIKEESSGKDLVYYCGYTSKVWNPEIAIKTGVGGSEEAVINLSRELAKLGWNVTVYNNCGHGGIFDGVEYKPYWEYNVRDKQDVTIFWRHPKPVDYDPAGRVFIDLHDVISDNEFTAERVERIDGVFVKSQAHRMLFPSIPDEKVVVVPNGVDASLFDQEVERNPYLILNTSSADRHLDVTLDVFEELVRRDPEKPWKLAWYYGWGVFDSVHANDTGMKAWKTNQMRRLRELVNQGRAEGGTMLGHEEIAKKYLEAGIFLYPTQFYEIDCISARKAQVAGCRVITSDFAALNETVEKGTKIHTEGEKWQVEKTFGDSKNIEKYVEAVLSGGEGERLNPGRFSWGNIANKWHEALCAAK